MSPMRLPPLRQLSIWDPRQKVRMGTPVARAKRSRLNSRTSFETSSSVSPAYSLAASSLRRSGRLQPYFRRMSSERSLPSAMTRPSMGRYSASCSIVFVVRGMMMGAPPNFWMRSRWNSPKMSTYLCFRMCLRVTQRMRGNDGASRSSALLTNWSCCSSRRCCDGRQSCSAGPGRAAGGQASEASPPLRDAFRLLPPASLTPCTPRHSGPAASSLSSSA
mmetsp:Transcript_57111/g.124226  ORF Transcript_57111/g.124226 Transcript_57111/m.124226 type:complete len:219 (+) Transcript_57111:475-1131(+)